MQRDHDALSVISRLVIILMTAPAHDTKVICMMKKKSQGCVSFLHEPKVLLPDALRSESGVLKPLPSSLQTPLAESPQNLPTRRSLTRWALSGCVAWALPAWPAANPLAATPVGQPVRSPGSMVGSNGKKSTKTSAKASAKNPSQTPPPEPPAWDKPEKSVVTMAAVSPQSLVYLPLLVAQQLGSFAQRGIALEIMEPASLAQAHQAVATGAADVVCGWLENALAQQTKAQMFESFVVLARAPQVALGLAARWLPPALARNAALNAADGQAASTPAQQLAMLHLLKGRKIGVIALHSPTHTVAHAMLRRAGLQDAQMSFVSVGSAASALAALRSGQIDALAHLDPLMMQLQQRGEIALIAQSHSPDTTQLATGLDWPSACLYATPDFLRRFPGTAQAISEAMLLALRWLAQASLLDITKLLPDAAMGEDRQAFIGSLARLRAAHSPDGLMPPGAPAQLLAAMKAADPTQRLEGAEGVDAAKSYTNAFAQRSLQRLQFP